MNTPFDFNDLVAEFSVPVQIILPLAGSSTQYSEETGKWIPPTSDDPIDTEGAVIPYSSNQLYKSGGRLSEEDRQLVINMDLPTKSIVISGGHKYSVEQEIPYKEYCGFNQYDLKWVSAFEQ